MTMELTVRGLRTWWAQSWSDGSRLWQAGLLMATALWATGLANILWDTITRGDAIAMVVMVATLLCIAAVFLGRTKTEKGGVAAVLLVGVLGLSDVLIIALGSSGKGSVFELIIASVLTIAYGGAILVAAYWVLKFVFVGPAPRVEKLKPDVLADEAAVEKVASVMNHAAGVYAGDVMTAPLDQGCAEDERHALHASVEDRAVVIGPPGTGKTAFLVSQILDWAESRRSLVVLDIKPEIYGITQAALVDQGYEVITYNPTSQTGHRYNPLDDLDGPEALGEMAAALIPSASAEDAVFHESARDFLDALVTHLFAVNGAVSLPEIRDYIAGMPGYKALMRELAQSPDGDAQGIAKNLMMTAANERLLGSIFATFQSNLRFLRYPAVRDSLSQSDFSLSRLTDPVRSADPTSKMSSKPVALFLQFEEQHRETTARLMAFMMGHILRYLITHSDRPAVLLLFDEIGSAPIIPGLVTKLNTIRSRKMPLWMYWQSMEQMQKYGEKANEGPNTILGACDLQMVFRLNDNASAEWMSQRIGLIDREVRSRSVGSGGGDGIGWSTNVSRSLVEEPIIFAHELQALPPSDVVCTYRGHTWRGQATPYFERWPQFLGQAPETTVALPYSPSMTLQGARHVARPAKKTVDVLAAEAEA